MNLRSLAAPGIKAVKDNWRAIVLIQVCFVGFVIFFYSVPSLQTLPQSMSAFRNRVGGPIFVLGMMWTASVLVPEIAKRVTKSNLHPMTWKDLVLRLVYFGIVALSVDAFYTWMGHAYGQGPEFSIVAKKVLTDMFVYSPFLSIPLAAIAFLYQDMGFSAERTRAALRQGLFMRRFMSTLVMCWMYFGPVTMAMYSLPLALNFPVAMTANAAWGIIVLRVGANATEGHTV